MSEAVYYFVVSDVILSVGLAILALTKKGEASDRLLLWAVWLMLVAVFASTPWGI